MVDSEYITEDDYKSSKVSVGAITKNSFLMTLKLKECVSMQLQNYLNKCS